MARYIDADALKEVIATNVYLVSDCINSRDYGMFWTGGIEKAIDEQPTADVVERKKGEWIFNPNDAIELMFAKPKCSECGFESADGGNFCSNCGARMVESQEVWNKE